jgi:tetratricopeptide (TPR) repeat protein
MAAVFLSYRRDDSAGWVGRLSEALRKGLGRDNVFMDIDSLAAGEDFAEAIERTVASCDVLAAVIGPRWLSATNADGVRRLDEPDDYVRLEIAAALERRIRVIPVLVGNASMPSAEQLPDQIKALARRQAYELSDKRWDYDVQGLLKSLRGRAGTWRRTFLIGGAATVAAAVVLGLVIVATDDRSADDTVTTDDRPGRDDGGDLGQAVGAANQHLLAAIQQIEDGRPDAALLKIRDAEAALQNVGSNADNEDVRLLRGYVYKTGAQAARAAQDDNTARTYADLARKVFRSIDADAETGRISSRVLAGALNGLGNVLCHEDGDCGAAVASYRRATDLEPDYVYAWHDMLLAQIALANDGQVDIEGMRHALGRLKELASSSSLMTSERLASLAQSVDSFASQGEGPGVSPDTVPPR